jgi:hypothetical protein
VKNWLAIVLGSAISIIILWFTRMPLGVLDEWTWDRTAAEPDFLWNIGGGTVAAALYISYVLLGRNRFESFSKDTHPKAELAIWLCGLAVFSFAWIWIVQEISPIQHRLGKSAFVLFYPSSSGYFTRSRYDEPRSFDLLSGYEELMREGDVLHTGTHPPGLFLVFHGLIAACESWPSLSAILDATQPPSFREACDVIATNVLRARVPRPLLPLDRRVLWLATVLVMLCGSLTVIPLYGLLCQSSSRSCAWTCAALWPAMPAVAIFVPKSDAVFPLFGVTLLWLWMKAWQRRSLSYAVLAGMVTWCGLMCSLAFLPVLLAAAMTTLGPDLLRMIWSDPNSATNMPSEKSPPRLGVRHCLCIVSAGLGFALPTALVWWFTHLNMLNVWWMNYRNHAGFYSQYPRTYWKWLLANPIEVCFAAGWPITMLAMIACWYVLSPIVRGRQQFLFSQRATIVVSLVAVWGLLWLTGKNSGEAGRLWLLFLPWLIWLANIHLDTVWTEKSDFDAQQRDAKFLLAIQFAVCLLTVTRVNGFHVDG